MSTSPIEMTKEKKDDKQPLLPEAVVPPPTLPPVQTLLSKDQAHELWEVLHDEPLTGTPVLIPLGKYAFLPGQLQPHRRRRRSSSSSSRGANHSSHGATDATHASEEQQHKQQHKQQMEDDDDEEEEELVTIHNDNTTIDITRSKAQEWLRSGSPARRPHHNNNNNSEPATTTTQSRPSSLQHSTTTTTTTTTSTHHYNPTPTPRPRPPVSQAAAPPPAPPLVDIQEEYDAHGNPVRANVVDMNQRLESLWKVGLEEEDQEETKMDPTVHWMDTILQPSSRPTPHHQEDDPWMIQEEPPLKSLDDTEYDRLAQRLEELARLEEQELRPQQRQKGTLQKIRGDGVGKKNVIMDPSRRNPPLQGGGWKKGFLSSSSTTAARKKRLPNPTQPPGDDNTTQVVSSTRKSSPSVQIDITQNQVHEIPRIGTQKVPPKQQHLQQQQQQQQQISFEASLTAAAGATPPVGMEQEKQERQSLDSSVFSGVIQERQPMVKGRPVISEHDASTSSSSPSSTRQQPVPRLSSQSAPNSRDAVRQQTTKQPPKRMSRFAQEQMEK